MNIDYSKLGLKAGLEIHQQLNTTKLFMRTQSTLSEENNFCIQRKLRPVASELGEYDKAALDAFKRNETFYYSGDKNNISLVELDEEPPQQLNLNSLNTAIEVALLCKSNLINRLSVMRKNIIDGSNTSAFQRTMLLSIGGEINIENKKIRISTIALEEDSARPLKKENGNAYYCLDRLGIPLIEIATEPDITTPKEAVETAKKIGELIRITCKSMRGKGTIRQDVNVSITKGTRCEIKGCQELELIGTIIEKEVKRQLDLINIMKTLNDEKQNGKIPSDFFGEITDLTNIFLETNCKFIKGKNVFGIRLNGMKGILGTKIGDKRFGTELSYYAKATGVTGILHYDELPNYGISENEIEKILTTLNCIEDDSFILIVANKISAENAFKSIKKRILIAFEQIPGETRGALEDGSSIYQRPLAGGARMYPETDLLEQEINEKMIKEIKKTLTLNVSSREKKYEKIGLNENFINGMKLNNYARFFESLIEKKANPKVAANLLLNDLPELKRKGINVDSIPLEDIEELLILESKGKISKNNLKSAIEKMSNNTALDDIIDSTKTIDKNEAEKIVSEIVNKNADLVSQKKLGAVGPLMGDVMKSLKDIDGKYASELLKKEIEKKLN
jgi:glutamyl-tRNA(Gln) amidotransferase subunit E